MVRNKKQQTSMAKKRPEPVAFADRGLRRVLAENLGRNYALAVFAKVSSMSPLTLSHAAKVAVERVSKIYELRGFSSCSREDLTHVSRERWALSWVDGRWDCGNEALSEAELTSMSFSVATPVGPWRVGVSPDGCISSAFPIIDADLDSNFASWKMTGRRDGSRQEPPDTQAQRRQRAVVAKRLQQLGASLQDCDKKLRGFLDEWCPESMVDSITELSGNLQQQCRQDLPLLSSALEWKRRESWTDWTWRVTEELGRACSTEEQTLPVHTVSFTHDSISTKFLHGEGAGKDVEKLVEDLRRGRVDPMTHRDLVLEVVRYDGKIHSLNNRRLWALQQHHLLLLAGGVEVKDLKVRVRILPWTEPTTLKRFLQAFTSVSDGDKVACRTMQAGAPPEAVVATTLERAVMSTSASVAAERKRQSETLGAVNGVGGSDGACGGGLQRCRAEQRTTPKVWLGNQAFNDWRTAKEHVREIMHKHSSGKALPAQEFQLLMDVFQYHPAIERKRLPEVTRVTVGSSEKCEHKPCFWIWRSDGSGEDISINKCFGQIAASTRR